MLIRFCPADNESATEEFLIVQFLHGAFCFLDALHLHKSKSFRCFLCVGPHRASGVSVFRMNKSSCWSSSFFQLLKWRSAPKSFGTPSAACESSRAQSNFLLCDANGNSASSCRKRTRLEAKPGALRQRNSIAAIVCSISSRTLNRRRNRTLGRSKKIPDISA